VGSVGRGREAVEGVSEESLSSDSLRGVEVAASQEGQAPVVVTEEVDRGAHLAKVGDALECRCS
jgi:hypothetical protein